jgi:hypothetical protein
MVRNPGNLDLNTLPKDAIMSDSTFDGLGRQSLDRRIVGSSPGTPPQPCRNRLLHTAAKDCQEQLSATPRRRPPPWRPRRESDRVSFE